MKSEGHPKYQLYAHPVSEQHRTVTDYWWAYTVRGTPQISFWCSACTRVTSVIHGLLLGIYEVRTAQILVVCRVCIRTTQDIHTLLVGNKSQGDTPNISSMLSVYQNDTGHSQPTREHLQSWGTPQISPACSVRIRTAQVIQPINGQP